ncbi:ER to Golgi transporter Yif1 [Lipomyces japonicus]|uniref:ER to Golgi transporter Yif1 n=1 Tax=Lipomyces japonicus TaxID=56871 RepID=UPI0034CF45D1
MYQSPPLHHPVPQHPIPPIRSPPLQQQASTSSSSGGGGSGSNPYVYGNLFSDSTAQVGLHAVMAGQNYVEQNLGKYMFSVSSLKTYFDVSNSYVWRKLALVVFPWRHRPWTRQVRQAAASNSTSNNSNSIGGYLTYYAPPRDDVNAPDMYIPVMAFVTYVLLSSIEAGIRGAFHPELLGYVASTAFAVVIFEIVGLKLTCYVLGITSGSGSASPSSGEPSQVLDLVAYSGYKFIGVILTMLALTATGSGLIKHSVFAYVVAANGLFLLRSLKYVILPASSSSSSASSSSGSRSHSVHRPRRIQFLFAYSFVCQAALMWVLVRA